MPVSHHLRRGIHAALPRSQARDRVPSLSPSWLLQHGTAASSGIARSVRPSSWACAPSKTRTIHSSTPRYRAKANAEARPLSELAETYKKQLVVFGLGVAVMGAYIAMLIRSMTRVDACADQTPLGQHGQHGDIPSGRPLDLRSGKITATAFDREQDWNEWIMGITGLRKLMGGLARGHVLEVAVGTGRNIEYMDWDEIKNTAPRPADEGVGFAPNPKSPEDLHRDRVKRRMEKGKKGLLLPGDDAPEVLSFTGVDVSADVLEVTWTKLKKAVPELIPRRRRKVNEGQQAQQETQETQETQQQQQQQKSVEEKKPVTFRNPLKALSESKMPAPARHPAPPAASQTKDQALAANIGSGRIRLFKSDAQSQLPSPPPMLAPDAASTLPAPRYFDTILQNFAICSVADPHQLLANMARVLRPGSGRIYLLEHGRGRYDWINGLLDKFAPSHFDRYGCWWNRDIEEAVRRAEREVPGLEVVRIERPLWTQGGTMYWVELRVNPQKEHGSGNGSDSGNRTPADSSGRPTSRPAA